MIRQLFLHPRLFYRLKIVGRMNFVNHQTLCGYLITRKYRTSNRTLISAQLQRATLLVDQPYGDNEVFKIGSNHVDAHFPDGSTLEGIPLIWLRDCCQCPVCFNHKTSQRNDTTQALTSQLKINSIEMNSDTVAVNWSDGHCSKYDVDFLKSQYLSKHPAKTLWTRSTLESTNQPRIFDAILLESRDGIREVLQYFLVYGFALIEGVESSETATNRAISSIARPFESIYGAMWTFTSDATRSDTAYSTVSIAPHTDLTYYQTPARIMALHCIERDQNISGGHSIFVDGFEIARQLKQLNEAAYKTLFEISQEFCYIEETVNEHHHLSSTGTILRGTDGSKTCDPDELLSIRFNMYDRGRVNLGHSGQELEMLHMAMDRFKTLTLEENNQWRKVLTPGTLLFFDNWRVLHGRTNFEGKRVLTGCYIAEEEFSSALSKFCV